MKRLMVLLTAALCVLMATMSAKAATEKIEKTFTIASGANQGSTTLEMPNSNIKEVILTCPTLDSGDTATAYLTVSTSTSAATSQPAGATVLPHGWANKSIGATDDGKTFYCTDASTNIYAMGSVSFAVQTSTNQEAARTFKVIFIREY